jgi:tetratricopeptide (TPR) repeat protein
MGEKSQAVDQFRQALQLNPNDASARFNLAALLAELGQNEEAISHFQQAIRVRPDFVEAHFELAKTLASVGRSEEAVAVAQQAVHANPAAAKQPVVEQLQQWLQHYQTELRRKSP